jgi:hypothetical protein
MEIGGNARYSMTAYCNMKNHLGGRALRAMRQAVTRIFNDPRTMAAATCNAFATHRRIRKLYIRRALSYIRHAP